MASHEFFMPTQESIPAPSPMGFVTMSKVESIYHGPINGKISKYFHNFVEMVGLQFKAIVEANGPKENRETTHEERTKLLTKAFFEVDGLLDDEAMLLLQVLGNNENQLNMFLSLPENKRMYFC